MDSFYLAKRLDAEFGIPGHQEDLIEWAVTDANKSYICQEFLEGKTGLMLKSSTDIERAYTSVFASDAAMEKLNAQRDCLLLTHHNFNYHEDDRGLTPIEPEMLQRLTDRRICIYVAHAPLDTHPELGTSITLARLIGVSIEGRFYDYFGAPTGVFGRIPQSGVRSFADRVQRRLLRPIITLIEHRPYVEKVAVVAGGGDLPDVLQAAFDLGCDTLLTGTIENRWQVAHIQQANRSFHKLNEKLKLNLIGGTHYATERPAMMEATKLIKAMNMDCEYLEDEELLSAV